MSKEYGGAWHAAIDVSHYIRAFHPVNAQDYFSNAKQRVHRCRKGSSIDQTDVRANRSRARTNGATQTFRRPPVAPSLSYTREASQNFSSNSNIPSPGVYVPPHLNTTHQSSLGRNGPIAESRYSKDQLLDLFRAQADSATSSKNLSDLFVGGWNPGDASTNSNGAWSKKDDLKDSAAGPEVCWDHEGKVIPLAMIDITEEEREVPHEPHLL